jgi:hypothetical protein
MARGWESKSVEDQVAAAEAAKEARAKPHLTERQQAEETERQSILLSRAQVMNRLKLATNPRYRAQLESALKDLDAKLVELQDRNQ